MAYQYKVTITGPVTAEASSVNEWRFLFAGITGHRGSPAVKSLYQEGKISAYPEMTSVVTGAGDDTVAPTMTALYEFPTTNDRENFIMSSHDYADESNNWRDALIIRGYSFSGESIDT